VYNKGQGGIQGEDQHGVCDPLGQWPWELESGGCRVTHTDTPPPTPAADVLSLSTVANFDPGTFSLMRCDFCGAGFDTRAGLSSHARAHLRDFGITNWELTVSPINILQELLATSAAERPPSPLCREAGVPPSGFLTSRRPRLPLTVPFPPTWAEDPGPAYGDGKGKGGRQAGALTLPRGLEGWRSGRWAATLLSCKCFQVTLPSRLTTVPPLRGPILLSGWARALSRSSSSLPCLTVVLTEAY